jgi:hypothetical protein
VIAHQGDQSTSPGKGQELVRDAAAVRTTVDVVAERHDLVLGAGPNCLDQRREGLRATVYVANGDSSMGLLVVALQTCPRWRPNAWLAECGSTSTME